MEFTNIFFPHFKWKCKKEWRGSILGSQAKQGKNVPKGQDLRTCSTQVYNLKSEQKGGILSNGFQPCVWLICMANHCFIHSQFPDILTVVWTKDLTGLSTTYQKLQQIPMHLHYKRKDIFLIPGEFNGRWKEGMKVGGREVRKLKMSLCWWNSYLNVENILNMLFWKVLKIIKKKRAVKNEQEAMNWEIKCAQCRR